MNRKEIKAKIREKRAKMDELRATGSKSDSIEELKRINSQMDELRAEVNDLEDKLLDTYNDGDGKPEPRGASQPIGATHILGTYGMGQAHKNNTNTGSDERMENGNVCSTQEYRSAFMNYVLRGARSEILEQRANATTLTADVGTVIPNTITNRIYEKLTSHSMIWDRITKTSVKGGVSVPISSLKPVATWVAEGSVSDTQKKTTGSVIFSYYKLQCRVALSLEADTVSLDMFETTLVENIYEAMIVAIETAVVAGTGAGQPLGITVDPGIPGGQVVAVKAVDLGTHEKWTDIVSNIPLAYESKVVLTMTKKDWDKYVVGMVDANGQPVARVTYGLSDRPERRFLGYEVVLVDNYLTSFDAAVAGEVFAFFVDYKDYIFNSNLQYTYKKYVDEATDGIIHKATLLADGKLAAPHSVILLKKSV